MGATATAATVPRGRIVVEDDIADMAALAARALDHGVNALCWRRALAGDFAEVARALAPPEGLVEVDEAMLAGLVLSAAGRAAADVLVQDLRALAALGKEPVLNCITSYPRDERGLAVATDVMSFHADSAPVETDTWLCTYAGASSEGLDNDDAVALVDVPGVRAALRRAYRGAAPAHPGRDARSAGPAPRATVHGSNGDDGDDGDDGDGGGDDGDGFRAFLADGAFDLHYAPRPGAEPFSFGVGHMWRIAVAWPGCPVPPCLHRAPSQAPGDATRLLLIC